MGTINYKFISAREGGQLLKAYIPASDVSKSGVTIATGFDLGQRSESDLTTLGLSTTLVEKLKPYLGLQKKDAKKLLKESPLTITSAEAESIDKKIKAKLLTTLKNAYDNAKSNKAKKKFSELPSEAQTVIASVAFQYGNPKTKTPKFWKAVTSQDWKEAVKELKNFGDKYPTRRRLEAALLEKVLRKAKSTRKCITTSSLGRPGRRTR